MLNGSGSDDGLAVAAAVQQTESFAVLRLLLLQVRVVWCLPSVRYSPLAVSCD